MVKAAPLNADAVPKRIELVTINNRGFLLDLEFKVNQSKIPIPGMWIQVKIPYIVVHDAITDAFIAECRLSDSLLIDSNDDLLVKQRLLIDFCENVQGFKSIIKRLSIVGAPELDRISVKISFHLTVSINDWFYLDRIPCEKVIHLGELRNKKQTSSQPKHSLFPDAEISTFANPGLRGLEAGLDVVFSEPPHFLFRLGKVKCKTLLNGSTVAFNTITGLYLSSDSVVLNCRMEIQPSALSAKPVTGALTSAKGIIKGIFLVKFLLQRCR
jgi:hypothetical protein